jgi:hypothetical protein
MYFSRGKHLFMIGTVVKEWTIFPQNTSPFFTREFSDRQFADENNGNPENRIYNDWLEITSKTKTNKSATLSTKLLDFSSLLSKSIMPL